MAFPVAFNFNNMKQFFTKLGLACLLTTIGLSGNAADPIFNFTFDTEADFTDNFQVVDGNEDGVKWKYNSYSSGKFTYAQCYSYSTSSYNDSMITKAAFQLQAGQAYKLNFLAWGEDSDRTICSQLAIGIFPKTNDYENAEISSLFSKRVNFVNKYSGNPSTESYEEMFEVPEDGEYQFVFMAIGSDKGGVAIDNITLTAEGSPLTPAEVSALSASAASDFSLSATLSITLPSKTVTGSDLAENGISKVVIFRGDDTAATITTGLTPGETISWTDLNAAEGWNTYTVVVFNGDLGSAPVVTTVFVGPLTPLAPTAAKAEKTEGGKIKVSWTAPVKSTTDIALDASLLTYSITRTIGDGEPETIITGLAETEYEDSFTSDDLTTILYTVTAYYGTKVSEGVATNPVKVGTYGIPFEESFAHAVLPDDWEITTSDTSTYAPKQWQVRSSMEKSPYATSYDEDGGLLSYNSFNISSNYWSRAITPEIKIAGNKAPTLEFMFYHSGTQSGNDRIVLEISKDGGELTEIPDSEIKRNNGTTGWTLYSFPLNSYIDANSIRISFKAISAYGADMAIDAIRIYNGTNYDLEAVSLEAPAAVKSGKHGEFKFTVKNSAFSEVKADQYSVKVYAEGELVETLESMDIAPAETKEFDFTIPSHAGHIESGIPVYCEIDFAEDEKQENNISQEVVVSVEPYQAKAVGTVSGSVSGNTLTLSWPEIEIEDYQAMESAITLDREEDAITKEAYDEDHSIAYPATFTASDGKVWQNIDNDGKICNDMAFPGVAKAFMYTSKAMRNNSYHADHSGEESTGMLVAVSPKYVSYPAYEASDYLVSPMLPGEGYHILSFYAKPFASDSGDFTVEYATEEYTIDDISEKFVALSEKITMKSSAWTEYSFVIPSSAKYVAIHFVSKAPYSSDERATLCLDDIRLTSEPFAKPTYNVYYREYPGNNEQEAEVMRVGSVSTSPKRHNDSPIEEASYVLAAPTVSTDYHVSAVYPDGETDISTPYRHDISTGVIEIEAENEISVKVAGRQITATANGETVLISVYAVDGSILANGVEKFIPETSGAYIVKAADKAVTVMVK